MAISSIRTSFASLAALLSLLAGCASTPPADSTQLADNSATAAKKCNEDRPTTGTSISHHDCLQHGNVATADPSDIRSTNRNTGAPQSR